MGRQCLPADARLAAPPRRLAGRHLRRAAGLRARTWPASASTSLLCAIAPTIGSLIACAGAAGHRRRAARPELAGGHHRHLPAEGARRRRSGRGRRGAAIAGRSARWSADGSSTAPRGAGSSSSTCRSCSRCLLADPRASSRRRPRAGGPRRRVDVLGALLCALGLGGVGVRADRAAAPRLVEPGRDAARWSAGVVLLAAFLVYESRAQRPDAAARPVPLAQLRGRQRRDARACTAGSRPCSSSSSLYLQQVAGYSPLESGLALLPVTPRDVRALARASARSPTASARGCSWAAGRSSPAGGPALLLGAGRRRQLRDRPPPGASSLFSLGLSMTVAPLTATVLAGAARTRPASRSAVNNAVARVAGLIAIAAVGALVAAQFSSSLDQPPRRPAADPARPRRCAQAKQLTLGRPSVAGVPPRQARAIVVASDRARRSTPSAGPSASAACS